jgi:hypothetical protein
MILAMIQRRRRQHHRRRKWWWSLYPLRHPLLSFMLMFLLTTYVAFFFVVGRRDTNRYKRWLNRINLMTWWHLPCLSWTRTMNHSLLLVLLLSFSRQLFNLDVWIETIADDKSPYFLLPNKHCDSLNRLDFERHERQTHLEMDCNREREYRN